MLAFNLGVFFRNLKGEEVFLSAYNEHCEVRFRGGVETLEEHTDLSHHLTVTLANKDLSCRIAFEEAEEEETPEHTEVEVELTQKNEERETVLLRTTFRFEEITLKPASGAEEEEEPDDGPLTA
jgi:phosphoribosyl-ATP pyrophosphohydrolase